MFVLRACIDRRLGGELVGSEGGCASLCVFRFVIHILV